MPEKAHKAAIALVYTAVEVLAHCHYFLFVTSPMDRHATTKGKPGGTQCNGS